MGSDNLGKEDWQPSGKTTAIVLLELLSFDRPSRFEELWIRCKAKMSRTTFAKALDALEKRGFIIRNQRGRKHVEYMPNWKDPSMSPLRKDIVRIRNDHDAEMRRIRSRRDNAWLLGKVSKMNGETRRELLTLMVQAEASALAGEICDKVFNNALWDAKSATKVPLVQTLFTDQLLALASVERQIITEIWRVDSHLVQEALNDWRHKSISNSLAALSKAYRLAGWRPRRTKIRKGR